jgi:hypothetical protein
MVFVLTEGQRHEQPVPPPSMEQDAVKRVGSGQARIRPDRGARDQGASRPTIR